MNLAGRGTNGIAMPFDAAFDFMGLPDTDA
jgi:hypothetical protein